MIPACYLVTLKDTPHKHDYTVKHLRSHGIEPKVIWGFSGLACAVKSANPYGFDDLGNGKYAPPSTIGCSLSHMTALACACANREEEFIIFEDDIKLPDDFGKKWSEFRKKVPDWVDVIHLDHAHHDAAVHSKINDALERSFYPFGSGAIWWRGWKVADKALHLLRPVNGPYDCLLIRYVFPFMGHACAVPKICDQRSGNGEWSSTIGSSCWMSEYENAKGIPLK